MWKIFHTEIRSEQQEEIDGRIIELLDAIEDLGYQPIQMTRWTRNSYADPHGITVYARKK
jgi:hypothetical protein